VTIGIRQSTGSIAKDVLIVPVAMPLMRLGIWLFTPEHMGKVLDAIAVQRQAGPLYISSTDLMTERPIERLCPRIAHRRPQPFLPWECRLFNAPQPGIWPVADITAKVRLVELPRRSFNDKGRITCYEGSRCMSRIVPGPLALASWYIR
jgi:hypothetical protein